MRKLIYLLLPLFLFAAQDVFAQGKIVGRITDEEGEPQAFVPVVIPALQTGANSNNDGYYTISDVPAGTHTVIVQSNNFKRVEETVTVEDGEVVRLEFVLEPFSTEEIVVEDNAVQIERQKAAPGQVKIESGQIKALPSLGTPDLAQYLQVLPGVVFTGDQGGQLYVRGGTPIQNMTIFDGAIIYNAFHTIGLYSIFDTEIIRNVDVYSGGFPSEYGGRVSSVMNIETRNGSFKKFGGSAHVNPITAGALVEGPLFKGKDKDRANASYMFSLRNCYLNQTSESLYSYVNDTAGLPFSFTDLYGKVTLGNGSNQINLFGFYQTDNVDYGYPTSYGWEASGGGINYSFLPPNSSVIMSGNFAISNFSNEQQSVDERYPRNSLINGFNGRLNFDHIVNNINQFTYGLQLLGFRTNLEFTNSLGVETQQEKNNTEMAVYAKYRHVFLTKGRINESEISSSFERVVLEPGIRLHYYNDQSQVMLEPRFRAKYNANRFVSFSLATGMYSQNLISAVSDRDVVTLFQGFLAAPDNIPDPVQDHALQTAWHLLGSIEYQFNAKTKITLEGWYKDFTQLSNVNRARTFPEDSDFITETGNAVGADFIIDYRTRNLSLYATYGLARVQRDDGRQVYNPVFDRRHTINLVGSYTLGELVSKSTGRKLANQWEFSARWTMGTGFPFTQTQGFFEKLSFDTDGSQTDVATQNGDLGILLTDDLNGGRLPAYHRFDLSLKYRFLIGKDMVLELNANAINLYNRANIFYFDRVRYARVDQLPFMPTLGLKFDF